MKSLIFLFILTIGFQVSAQEAVGVLDGSNFDENGRLKLKSLMNITFGDGQGQPQTAKVPVQTVVTFIGGLGVGKGVSGSWGDFANSEEGSVEAGTNIGVGIQLSSGAQFNFRRSGRTGVSVTAQGAKQIDGYNNMNGFDISVSRTKEEEGDNLLLGGYYTDLRGHCRADDCFGKKGSQRSAGLQVGADLLGRDAGGVLVLLRFGAGWGNNFARYIETSGIDDKKRVNFQASINWIVRIGSSTDRD